MRGRGSWPFNRSEEFRIASIFKGTAFQLCWGFYCGFGANLGAGAILSNVRNDKRAVVVSMDDGTRFETGLKKLGAMIGDGSQIGCNVVTNPGTIIPSNSLVRPNENITGWFEI